MPLASNSVRDIELYIAEQMQAPTFPPFTAATLKTGTKYRYRAVYVTDTNKPAWMDSNGTWRYADGSAV